jgi:hypothetical protein
MADTTYLKEVVEPFVASWVSERIGVSLKPRRIPVGPRSDGTPVHFEFDGVSDDGRTGLLVSTGQTLKSGGWRKLFVDAALLLQADFDRRLLILVKDDVRQNFLNKCDGLLPLSRIEIMVCDALTPAMWNEIATVQDAAKKEVGDKGKQWKPGGRRR